MAYERIETDNQRFYRIPELNEDVPSSTTITKTLDKPALVPWAVKQAVENLRPRFEELASGKIKIEDLNVNELIYGAKQAHKEKTTEAADIGTTVHDIISQFHLMELKRGARIDDIEARKMLVEMVADADERVRKCIHSFAQWRERVQFTVKETEMMVWSKKYRYAGTLDAIGYINGHLSLVDYKSSSGIWPEYQLQATSYLMAYAERTGIKPKQVWIVRFGKDGSFGTKRVTNLRILTKGFIALRKVFDVMEFIKANDKAEKFKK